MKVCHKEAMKRIKELEDKKERMISAEAKLCTVQYKDGESRPDNGYSYDNTRNEVKKLDAEIRKIKHKLAQANCKVKVDGFDITLGEALVYLAQLNGELTRLNSLAYERQSYTSITANGITVHNECLYSVEKANADAAAVTAEIGKLQVAIDRANLVSFIDI